jgi:hypothetical protein
VRLGERSADDDVDEVVVSHTDAALEDLRRLKQLGVPHDELIKTFGHSGLGRYEKLLAERDARVPNVIEHIPAPAGAIEGTT